MTARLSHLQKAVDAELEKQGLESGLACACGPGCTECCSKCFCVSETEFVLIFDRMLRTWGAEDILETVRIARSQWRALLTAAPDIAQRLRGRAALKDLYGLGEAALPFPCVFLDGDGRCRVYDVRPLACRIHGVALLNLTDNTRPCALLPPLLTAWDRYADLTDFAEKISAFTFLKYKNGLIVRRPSPLFYYFEILFREGRTPEDIRTSNFFRFQTELCAEDYVRALIAASQEMPPGFG
jgi:Fe-S-cluster containining protein